LSRQHVFNIAKRSPELGVIAAIVWGFPRGAQPGGRWMSFAQAFDASKRFADLLADLKALARPATAAIDALSQLVKGINFATTTTNERTLSGLCLIFIMRRWKL
jgi:hypothetical protein